MARQWFIKGSIIISMLCFTGVFGEQSISMKEDDKYPEDFDPFLNPNEDEKAHNRMNERIREVIRQQNSKGLYLRPKTESARTYFYRKYMKIGKSKEGSSDNDIDKESSNYFQNNKFNMMADTSIDDRDDKRYNALPTISVNAVLNDLNLEKRPVGGMQQLRMPIMPPSKIVNKGKKKYIPFKEMFPLKKNSTKFWHKYENIPENNINNLYNKKPMDFNQDVYKDGHNDRWEDRIIMRTQGKPPDKAFELDDPSKSYELDDPSKSYELDDSSKSYELDDPSKSYELDDPGKSYELEDPSKSYEDWKFDHRNENKELRKYGNEDVNVIRSKILNSNIPENQHADSKEQGPMRSVQETKLEEEGNGGSDDIRDHRKARRSCELKMEDLRESYMPNEQLSIYHPKLSMTDQFILSDTMF